MWTIRVVAAIVFLFGYYWLLDSLTTHIAAADVDSRLRRLLSGRIAAGLLFVVVPLACLVLIVGSVVWKALLAAWIWALVGGGLGIGGALLVQVVEKRLPERMRDPVVRAVFWGFVIIAGLGVLGFLLQY
jgi:hypothetical protein